MEWIFPNSLVRLDSKARTRHGFEGPGRWLKAELHAHTRDDPVDGGTLVRHSAEELIDTAAAQGFEVLAITNHNRVFHNEALSAYAAERGVLLIPGVEATVRGKHVLLYNFLDYDGWCDFETVLQHKGASQLVIAPHPFFPSRTSLRDDLLRWLRLFDAIEYNHFYMRWINFNAKAERIAAEHGFPVVGNSDVHRLYQLGRTYTRIWAAEKDVNSVLEAIKEGRVEVVTEPVSPWFVSGWFIGSWLGRLRASATSFISAFF